MRQVWLFACLLELAGGARAADDWEGRITNVWSTAGLPERVELLRFGTDKFQWVGKDSKLKDGDQFDTPRGVNAVVQWRDGQTIEVRENSSLRVEALEHDVSFYLTRGWLFLTSRGRARQWEFRTPGVKGGARGTEYEVFVDDSKETLVTIFDGTVDVETSAGSTNATVAGGPPARIRAREGARPTVVTAENIVQWWLYYPAVLDVDELVFEAKAKSRLGPSLLAYRQGNFPLALELDHTSPGVPERDERVYRAAMRLIVGRIDDAEALLGDAPLTHPPAVALRTLIAAVNRAKPPPPFPGFPTPSEWLAQSYWLQATHTNEAGLRSALEAAQQARGRKADFSLAWAREAELNFSLGDIARASLAITNALHYGPSNSLAHALYGFVLAGANRNQEAIREFAKAAELDPALANARLGRGLMLFRRGPSGHANYRELGLAELQAAAAVEADRAPLRSYLGKAFHLVGNWAAASHEFSRAMRMDTNDPTPWLYRAWLHHETNNPAAAIDDVNESIARNNNRQVFRSKLRLDEDLAVRRTSLARIYDRAELASVAQREAARAVAADYENFSAHLFLADSFNRLRDPTRFNLRHETAWFNELLLANILAPVGAGTISQNVSQEEYSRLFERNGFLLSSTIEARSDGQFRMLATQSGVYARSAFSVDLDWAHFDARHGMGELDRWEIYPQIKQQVTDQDTLFVLSKFEDFRTGDRFQRYDPSDRNGDVQFAEFQRPLLAGAWRHEWKPGAQTLFLLGRLQNEQTVEARSVAQNIVVHASDGAARFIERSLDFDYRSEFTTWFGELQHIAKIRDHSTLVAGGRFHSGEFISNDVMVEPSLGRWFRAGNREDWLHTAKLSEDFERGSLYVYDFWNPVEPLVLIGGLSYDQLEAPSNFRRVPLTPGEFERSEVLPKAGFVWTPSTPLTLRGLYARTLSGVSFDESYRFEPVQLAGFTQAFRTVIPETLVGPVEGHLLDLVGCALDIRLPKRTYLGFEAGFIQSDVNRITGTLALDEGENGGLTNGRAEPTPEQIDYREGMLLASIDRLFDNGCSFRAEWRFTRSQLENEFPQLRHQNGREADLHRGTLRAGWQHRSGLFAGAESRWYWQETDQTDDNFQQTDLTVGWRKARPALEIAAGILNIWGDDCRLDPLSAEPELPRERVFFGRLKFAF